MSPLLLPFQIRHTAAGWKNAYSYVWKWVCRQRTIFRSEEATQKVLLIWKCHWLKGGREHKTTEPVVAKPMATLNLTRHWSCDSLCEGFLMLKYSYGYLKIGINLCFYFKAHQHWQAWEDFLHWSVCLRSTSLPNSRSNLGFMCVCVKRQYLVIKGPVTFSSTQC